MQWVKVTERKKEMAPSIGMGSGLVFYGTGKGVKSPEKLVAASSQRLSMEGRAEWTNRSVDGLDWIGLCGCQWIIRVLSLTSIAVR